MLCARLLADQVAYSYLTAPQIVAMKPQFVQRVALGGADLEENRACAIGSSVLLFSNS